MTGKYALIIANTEYTDPGFKKLTAPGKDAEDFALVLKSPEFAGFDDVQTIFNPDNATARQVIDQFFNQKKWSDLLVFYFSGHGIRDDDGSLFLAVKNTQRTLLDSTGIESAFIKRKMEKSLSKRQVLILDCCNSGAFFHGTKGDDSMGTQTAFIKSDGSGQIVLAASDKMQYAFEGDKPTGDSQNSVFTKYLISGLKGEADHDGDGQITVTELYYYVSDRVKQETQSKQTPTIFANRQEGEIYLRQGLPVKKVAASDPAETERRIQEEAERRAAKIVEEKERKAKEEAERVSRQIAELERQLRQTQQQLEHTAQEQEKKRKEDERMAENVTDHSVLQKMQANQAADQKTDEEQRRAKEKIEYLTSEKARLEKAQSEALDKIRNLTAEKEKLNSQVSGTNLLGRTTASRRDTSASNRNFLSSQTQPKPALSSAANHLTSKTQDPSTTFSPESLNRYQASYQNLYKFRPLTSPAWWILSVIKIGCSIGGMFLANSIVHYILLGLGLNSPGIDNESMPLLIAGTIWGLLYVFRGADVSRNLFDSVFDFIQTDSLYVDDIHGLEDFFLLLVGLVLRFQVIFAIDIGFAIGILMLLGKFLGIDSGSAYYWSFGVITAAQMLMYLSAD